MSTHDLVIQSVSKRFGDTVALDDVSLAIDHGEFVTLLGPSGCGKTTLLRLIAGFDVPDSGTIHLGRDDVTNQPAHRRDVHTVFQNYALFPHLTVARNVSFGLEQRRLDKNVVSSKVDEMLQLVQLPNLRDRLPSQLSGGQQQRVALARALVLEPRVLLLDEPLAALDRKLREAMQTELKQIQRSLGITFLFVTHDQDEALAMSDRIVVMNEGRIEQIGSPREIYERPSTRFTADFVGVSNLLAGRVKSTNGGGSVVETGSGRFTVSESLSVGEDILLSVRPECVRLEDSELAESLAGTVESIRYLGDSTQVRVRLEDGSTWVVADRFGTGRAVPDPGSHVYLSWNSADAVRLEQ